MIFFHLTDAIMVHLLKGNGLLRGNLFAGITIFTGEGLFQLPKSNPFGKRKPRALFISGAAARPAAFCLYALLSTSFAWLQELPPPSLFLLFPLAARICFPPYICVFPA